LNPAEYLLSFFKASKTDMSMESFRYPDLIAALDEIENAIDSWAAAGIDVSGFQDCLPRWKTSITNAFEEDGTIRWILPLGAPGPHTIQTEKLLPGDQACLQWAAEKMAQCSTSFTAEVREKMSRMIDECIREMQEDDLPQDLLLYVSRIIREARTALEEYDLTGDFKLSVAFDRLCNAIRIVKGKSTATKKWQSFWNAYVAPLFAQVAVGGTYTLLTASGVLPQIGS
jgi:hypothetical protein